jgi:membrane protein
VIPPPRRRGAAYLAGLAFWRGFLGFYRSDSLTHAASIAYYTLLSLFPLALLAVTILGHATADEADRRAVFSFVLRYFPKQFEFITTQLDILREQQVSLGVVGTAVLIWGAVGFFGAVGSAVNHAWGVQSRSFWQHKAISFVMLTVAGALLVVTLLLVSATHVVSATWFADVLLRFPGLLVLRSVAVRLATTAMFVLVVGLVYYFVPNTKVRLSEVWLGALVTGGLWKGAIELFSWYMHDMTRFTRVNGSIAAVVVFLGWVYVQAVILLYGAEFSASYARLRRESSPAPAQSPR